MKYLTLYILIIVSICIYGAKGEDLYDYETEASFYTTTESRFLTASGQKLDDSRLTKEEIATAIYRAEGSNSSFPYGILKKYKHTTPRQACINTIEHARRDWNGKGDFIEFLGSKYCPIGANNDPSGLNRNWVKNVKHYLTNPGVNVKL